MQEDAERTIREWEARLKDEELAEKRRVAPGWLDREEKILQPSRTDNQEVHTSQATHQKQSGNLMDQQMEETSPTREPYRSQEGDEMDRAFGGMSL